MIFNLEQFPQKFDIKAALWDWKVIKTFKKSHFFNNSQVFISCNHNVNEVFVNVFLFEKHQQESERQLKLSTSSH